ncbi:capsule biosynthesis protein [Caldimonas thermodepolymerans]|uniref:capsule biosynthesis protein n=1 Tax=Caldimonas thermodepolymerans TaxID=215580 RepID=UPI0022369894|nr:capsular biosynthesis protein [Caldimonas thermodepolymerans]UZG44642.1 capsular biosynthesis protein [Caldimonas thermodepolymerans]
MGPFFARLAAFLEAHGQEVHKVNFNGGDELYYRRRRAVAYTGRPEDWPRWLEAHLSACQADAVVLFGQTRPMHIAARKVAAGMGLPVYVFEEGYLRPDYVTLEIGGVNGDSAIPKDPAFYRSLPLKRLPGPTPTRQRFSSMMLHAMAYGLAANLMRWRYPHQQYHRSLNPLTEGFKWARGGIRKVLHAWTERQVLDILSAPGRSKQWFLLPLQVHNDSQIVHHSPYPSVEALIEEVMSSFARHADPRDWLVIKHHPMDRAYRDYTRFIQERAMAHGLGKRVMYIHDVHLPTLLKHARGVVTVNSTTGLQALFHGTPVLTLGDCFYAIPGLVSQKPLKSFWRGPSGVDMALFQRFRYYLITQNQINASFYADAPALKVPARVTAGQDDVSALVSQPGLLVDATQARRALSPVQGQLLEPLEPPAAASGEIWSQTQPMRMP